MLKRNKTARRGFGTWCGGLLLLALTLLLWPVGVALADPPRQQLTYAPQSAECQPYRLTTPTEIRAFAQRVCVWNDSKALAVQRLSGRERDRLGYDTAVVGRVYAFARQENSNCYTTQVDRAAACNADNAQRARTYRDAFTAALTEKDNASRPEQRQAENVARTNAEARERERRQQQSGAGGGGAGSGTAPTAPRPARGGDLTEDGPVDPGPEAAAPGCFRDIEEAQQRGHVDRSARLATLIDRTILGVSARHAIEAATCIDQLWDKINQVTSAISAVVSSLNHPIVAVLAALAGQIVGQIIGQLINNVLNAVCEAAQKIAEGIENRLQNALCIKGDFGLKLDPFKFNIDIPALECQGWSVDLLTGGINGQPIDGLDVNFNDLTSQAGSIARQQQIYDRAIAAEREAGRPLTPETMDRIRCEANMPGCTRRNP